MKELLFVLTAFVTLNCSGQATKPATTPLTVSPIIDKTEKTNQAIINALTTFLKAKNSSLTENKNWLQADFQKYVYPYLDIYKIENSKYGKDFYRPTLLEIISPEKPAQKIVKLAFIGHRKETGENQLKSVFNLLANVNKEGVRFSRYLNYATENWHTVIQGSVTYKIPAGKKANEIEIADQEKDIEALCKFFNCDPISITYFSCVSPKQIFEIKGFDYHPTMYVDNTGGLVELGNIIFSGNNSEIYTHEIVHIYLNDLFPRGNKFFDEGMATFIAGSGKFNYKWHKKKLAKFLTENADYDFSQHTSPYERNYFEKETSIPYVTAALIVERTMHIYGKDKVIELLKSDTELWTTLKKVGLTRENINYELRQQIKLLLTNKVASGLQGQQ